VPRRVDPEDLRRRREDPQSLRRAARARTTRQRNKLPLFAEQIPETTPEEILAVRRRCHVQVARMLSAARRRGLLAARRYRKALWTAGIPPGPMPRYLPRDAGYRADHYFQRVREQLGDDMAAALLAAEGIDWTPPGELT